MQYATTTCDFGGYNEMGVFSTSTCVTISDNATTTTGIPDLSGSFFTIYNKMDGLGIGAGIICALLAGIFFAKVWK